MMPLCVVFYSRHFKLGIPVIRRTDYVRQSRKSHAQKTLFSIHGRQSSKLDTGEGLTSAIPTSDATESETKEDIHQFPELYVRVHTCGKLYEKWKRERRYWSVPKGDIPFNIKYVDTAVNNPSQEIPTVVALHGAAGTLHLFDYLTSYLHAKGVRVVVPTLPDLTEHEVKVFRHSSEEKSQLIRDFLRELKISRVDMLVCHSGAFYPGLLLSLENQSPEIGSLTLLNPPGFLLVKVLKPYWMIWLCVRLLEFPFLSAISFVLLRMFLMQYKELKQDQLLSHVLSAITMVHANFSKNKLIFEELLHTDIPMLMAFAEDDKLIGKEVLCDMASQIVDPCEINRCDSDGRLINTVGKSFRRKVIAFENGGHYLPKRHPKIISEEIAKFLFENVLQKSKFSV